jgi:hypothetical protein
MLISCRSPQAGPDGFRKGGGRDQLELVFLLVEQPNADVRYLLHN